MNKDYHIIGLMSGTSLDGVDIVKCVFKKGINKTFVIEKSETFEYSNYWRNKLKNLHLKGENEINACNICLLYTSPSPRDPKTSRMPSSA